MSSTFAFIPVSLLQRMFPSLLESSNTPQYPWGPCHPFSEQLSNSMPQQLTTNNYNNNNNNNHDDIYSAVIMTRSLREFTRFIW